MTYNSHQSGFSLVETLVAITILLIVIVGPLAIVSSAANASVFASDQVTAFLLAQEGAELAQKARDDLVLAKFDDSNEPDPWDTFKTSAEFSSCFTTAGCGLEILDDGELTVTTCLSTDARSCQLHYTTANNERARFTHDSTNNTFSGFTRSITLQSSVAYPDEIRVVSKVTWFSGIARNEREVEVETFLFNIYGN